MFIGRSPWDRNRFRARPRPERRLLPLGLGLVALLPFVGAVGDVTGDGATPDRRMLTERTADPEPAGLTIALAALDATERGWVAEPNTIPGGARLGFGRAIPQRAAAEALREPENWRAGADGGLRLQLQITSPGAHGLRLGLSVEALPDDVRLAVAAPEGDADAEVVSGAEINARLAHDRAAQGAGDSPRGAPLFWTPLVRGETLSLELTLPTGVEPDALAIRLVRVSHLFRLPFTLAGERDQGPDDCHVDLACVGDPLLDRLARATAVVLYTRADGGSNACTGTLLADADSQVRIPLLLTAHHCIPDQALASSVETYWSHRAEAYGAAPARVPERVTGGAELLSARKTVDTSLLRLRRDPPPDAAFAAWSARLPEIDTEVVSVHYPHGQTAKVARGRVSAYRHCVDVDYCGADAEPDGTHYLGVTWAEGITSAGSSGAGAFRVDTGELVGVLTGGLSSCAAPTRSDDFGWFGWGYREEGLLHFLGSAEPL